MVQLEECRSSSFVALVRSFNSILVQLEAGYYSNGGGSLYGFQFHIGAIRSRLDFGWKVLILLKSNS